MVSVKLVAMGNIVSDLDMYRVLHWKSHLFTIDKEVKRYILPQKAEKGTWAYTDSLLQKSLPSQRGNSADLTIYILDAPLTANYYSRTLDGNRIVITYFQLATILHSENIPLENFLIAHIYAYVLLSLTKGNDCLSMDDEECIAHDYREGCLYDMCGVKQDVIYKSVQPIICERCKAYLLSHGVAKDDISIADEEMKKLERSPYYCYIEFFKLHPIIAFLSSSLFAIFLSYLANNIPICPVTWKKYILTCLLLITASCILSPFISKRRKIIY